MGTKTLEIFTGLIVDLIFEVIDSDHKNMQTANVEDPLAEVTPKFSTLCISNTTRPETLFCDEEWRPIGSEYPGYYAFSGGRIKGLNGKIFNSKLLRSGYVSCCIINNHSESVNRRVHILVAMTFIPNPESKPVVNHINGVRNDNQVSNLEWVTYSDNSGLLRVNNTRGDNRRRRVVQYTLTGQQIQIWDSVVAAAHGISGSTTSMCRSCSDIESTYRGYKWRYYDDMINQLPGEEWKSVICKDREFRVSNFGRIKTNNGRIIGSEANDGYMRITVSGTYFSVHRLVCLAWKPIENSETLVVNHIDNNRNNNQVENLEWVTTSGNLNHYCQNFLVRGSYNRGRAVEQLRQDGTVIEIFESAKKAFESTGVQASNLTRVCQGKRKSAGEFLWRYCNIDMDNK